MKTTDLFTAYAQTELCVIDHDPEFAELGNETGALYGYSAFVVAEADDGSRYAHRHGFAPNYVEAEALKPAERLAQRVTRALLDGRALNPAHWVEIQPRYGSPAYQAGGWEAKLAAEERAEAEAGY